MMFFSEKLFSVLLSDNKPDLKETLWMILCLYVDFMSNRIKHKTLNLHYLKENITLTHNTHTHTNIDTQMNSARVQNINAKLIHLEHNKTNKRSKCVSADSPSNIWMIPSIKGILFERQGLHYF